MIIAFSGPSGIGKGYLKESIKEKYPEVRELVWYTTRQLRSNELKNSNRAHLPKEEFRFLANAKELILVQEMFGNCYGVRRSDLLCNGRKTLLTEFHPGILAEAKALVPRIYAIGMVTDEIELLDRRLNQIRKSESPEENAKRLLAAEEEMRLIRDNLILYDKIINVSSKNEAMMKEMAISIFEEALRGGG